MKLKAKILWLAVVPLLLAIVAIGALFVLETKRLERQQSEVLEDVLLSAKRDELHNSGVKRPNRYPASDFIVALREHMLAHRTCRLEP